MYDVILWCAIGYLAFVALVLWGESRAYDRQHAAEIATTREREQQARRARERASNVRALRWLRRFWPWYVGMLAGEVLWLIWRLA
jgi:hypothetical protein